MTSFVVDVFTVYQIVKRLVQPFNTWDAYRLRVIDDAGNVLIPPGQRNAEQKASFRYIDVVVRNLKRLLAMLPGGSSRFATASAAVLLMREEWSGLGDEFFEATPALMEEMAANVISSGAIAGGSGTADDVVVPKKAANHYKLANMTVFPVDSDRYHSAMWGKHPRKKYKDVVGDDITGQAIRDYGRENPTKSIALQNSTTGLIQFLKRGSAK